MDQQVETLFAKSLVIDGLTSLYRRTDPDCVGEECESERVEDFAELMALNGVHIGSVSVSRTVDVLKEHYAFVTGNETSMVIEKAADIDRAYREGKFGVIFYSQRHYSLKGSSAPLSDWYQKGLRIFQLAYSKASDPENATPLEMLAGGSDQPEQALTRLGREVVGELNRLNMIVDVSHCSKPSVMETVELSKAPVLANHTNAKALTDHRRNKSDEELLAIAGTGGVIGVTLVGWMLDRDGDGKAGIDDFMAHVDYIADLVGIDHVGIASDSFVNGWEKSSRHYADDQLAAVDRWKRVVARLMALKNEQGERKYSDEDLQKILGLNFQRFYREVLV